MFNQLITDTFRLAKGSFGWKGIFFCLNINFSPDIFNDAVKNCVNANMSQEWKSRHINTRASIFYKPYLKSCL